MQSTSELYKTIRTNSQCFAETRVTIAGVIYEQDRILSLSTAASLFPGSTPSVGGTVSRQLDLVILPQGKIPRMAEIKVEVRMVIKDILSGEIEQESEWIPKGTFYIDTRAEDKSDGSMSIHGYDAMLKLEQEYLADDAELDDWPKTMPVVVAEISKAIGVSVDDRTVLNNSYMVELPAGYTMREVMGYIAAAHGGNWVITDAGKLRLISLACIPPETNYLLTESGDTILFGEVRILV